MHEKISKSLSRTIEVTSKMFPKLILFLFLSLSNVTFAQPGFDDDVDDETVAAPIDSNLILLYAGGIALGMYVLRKNEKVEGNKR